MSSEVILLGFSGGLFATWLMDQVALWRMRLRPLNFNGPSPVPFLLARWVWGILNHRRWVSPDMRKEAPVPREKQRGFFLHYLIGAVLGFCFFFHLSFLQLSSADLSEIAVRGFLFGILTNVFPWFLMYPAFGFGVCARKWPNQKQLLIFSFTNHLAYGLGLVVAAFAFLLWQRLGS